MDRVTCPSCGKQIEITQALKHQLEEKIRKAEQEKHKEELEKAKAQIALRIEKRLKEESEQQIQKANKEKEELQKKLLEEKKDRADFERKTSEEVFKKLHEEQDLKLKEKDLQLEQIRKANEELRRKLEQGSQQRQGEVLELGLEEKLRSQFPNDEFLPIPKGIEGGDIYQKVKFQGRDVGSILWETKRTKAWNNGWVIKLKDDAAKIKASEAIIISQMLPANSAAFDRKDGVWIAKYEYAINICRFIRFLLTNIAAVKSSISHTEEEWGRIRDYMLSDIFKHRMQAHFDGVKALRELLDAEKRSTLLKWKKQEAQIEKLDSNTLNFYGELKTIVSNLPEINGIDTPILKNIDEKDS